MLERAVMAVLDAAGQVPGLWDEYVVKGGLALRYAYDSPRETPDLDFSATRAAAEASNDARARLHTFCDRLEDGLALVAPRYGFARFAVQYREFLTELPVLYARIGHTHLPDRIPPFGDYVEMQVTFNTFICETQPAVVEGIPVHVPLLEDILADKLLVLIQQPGRQTFRSSDVFDLWYYATHRPDGLDHRKLRRFLARKSALAGDARPLVAASYRDPAVKAHVTQHFQGVRDRVAPGIRMPTIDEAFDGVLRLVDALDLRYETSVDDPDGQRGGLAPPGTMT